MVPKAMAVPGLCTKSFPPSEGRALATLYAYIPMVYCFVVDSFLCCPGPEDRHLSYLPLAHVFERAVIGLMFSKGAKVGFFQGCYSLPSAPDLYCLSVAAPLLGSLSLLLIFNPM